MLAEITQRDGVMLAALDQAAHNMRDEDLAAMPRGQQARQPVQDRGEIVSVARRRLTGVQRHAHP